VSHPADHRIEDLSRFGFLSLTAGIVVLLLKLGAWQITGSVGLLSDALESTVNIAAAIVAIIALRAASKPPDVKHQFGHGKAEYFSSLIEGGMIIVAATLIIISAVHRLLEPRELEQLGIGLAISVLASLINAAVAVILLRVGRDRGSLALTADAHHLLTDLWTTGGVLVGVIIVGLTGWLVLDPLIGIAVAANIVFVGVRLLRKSASGLLDTAMHEDQVAVMRDVLAPYRTEDVAIHGVQTRQSGRQAFISMHVLVPGDWDVTAGHELCCRIEDELARALPGVQVMTHLEPMEDPRAWNDTHEGQHQLD
jgi:cation diffusion facilitator family transporter